MSGLTDKLFRIGVIPVVVMNDANDSLPLAEHLIKGGLPCAEITFRTDAAEESIRRMTRAFPEMTIGAGTVLTCEQADRAIDAGAGFIVSPGLNPRVTEHVISKGVPMIPGICTPTETEAALQFNLQVLKFFPAEPCGGLKTIKALASPYLGISFIPTGGIGPGNIRDYLVFDRIVACGGSWMVRNDLIKDGRFDEIETLTREAAGIVREIRG